MPSQVSIPDMHLWSQCIGGLIINFGIAEFLTLRCIEKCSGEAAALKIRGEKLGQRISAAKQAIDGSALSEKERQEAASLWEEIRELAKTRNRVAHNPIVLGFSPSLGGHVFSIIDLKKAVPSGRNEMEALDYQQISDVALRVAAISQRLGALIEAVPNSKK